MRVYRAYETSRSLEIISTVAANQKGRQWENRRTSRTQTNWAGPPVGEGAEGGSVCVPPP